MSGSVAPLVKSAVHGRFTTALASAGPSGRPLPAYDGIPKKPDRECVALSEVTVVRTRGAMGVQEQAGTVKGYVFAAKPGQTSYAVADQRAYALLDLCEAELLRGNTLDGLVTDVWLSSDVLGEYVSAEGYWARIEFEFEFRAFVEVA